MEYLKKNGFLSILVYGVLKKADHQKPESFLWVASGVPYSCILQFHKNLKVLTSIVGHLLKRTIHDANYKMQVLNNLIWVLSKMYSFNCISNQNSKNCLFFTCFYHFWNKLVATSLCNVLSHIHTNYITMFNCANLMQLHLFFIYNLFINEWYLYYVKFDIIVSCDVHFVSILICHFQTFFFTKRIKCQIIDTLWMC